ncbi:hypothetical protein BGZ76_004298, partial [Entomortierella beljakovae]
SYLEKQGQEVIDAKEQWQLDQDRNRFVRGRSGSIDQESAQEKSSEHVVVLTPIEENCESG